MGWVTLGRVGFLMKGDYSAGVSYEKLDVVHYDGAAYCALKSVMNLPPSNDGVNWALMSDAAKGAQVTHDSVVTAIGYTPADSSALVQLNAAVNAIAKIYTGAVAEGYTGTEYQFGQALARITANDPISDITKEDIEAALGYTPADAAAVSDSLPDNIVLWAAEGTEQPGEVVAGTGMGLTVINGQLCITFEEVG